MMPSSFEAYSGFRRLTPDRPLLSAEKPYWAAAAHAFVEGDMVQYLWALRDEVNRWELMHSTAPASDPLQVTHNPANPVFLPSEGEEFDNFTVEYPFPFRNPADGRLLAYYLGRRQHPPKQTGLLEIEEGFSGFHRLSETPVMSVEADFENAGCSHPSVAMDGDTIHLLYTGEFLRDETGNEKPVLCHATAPLSDPTQLTRDPANPVFTGSGQEWDSQGVREAEILKGPDGFDIFYGGSDGTTWRMGHVHTQDFRSFKANPNNPVFSPSEEEGAWDCDGILTPQVFTLNGNRFLLYAGMGDGIWQTGLAVAED